MDDAPQIPNQDFFQLLVRMEDAIFDISEESFNNAIDLIQEVFTKNNGYSIYIKSLISYASTSRFKKLKLYFRLLLVIQPIIRIKFNKQLVTSEVIPMDHIFFAKKFYKPKKNEDFILVKDNIPFISYYGLKFEDICNVFEQNSLRSFILYDDIEGIQKIDLNENTFINLRPLLPMDAIVSPMEFAAMCGSINIFKYLLLNNHKIDKEIAGLAIRGGNFEIIKLCENFLEIDENLANYATEEHHNEIVEWLFTKYDIKPSISVAFSSFNTKVFIWLYDQKQTALNINQACSMGHIEVVKLYLKKDDKKIKDYSDFLKSIDAGCLELVKYLINIGYDVNESNYFLYAVFCQEFEIAKFLLEKGADPKQEINSYIIDGKSALVIACKCGEFEIVEILVKNGANVYFKTIKNKSVLYYAVKSNNFKIVSFLVPKYVHPGSDCSALVLACEKGYLNIVQLLVKNGADVNNPCTLGRKLPIEAAIENKRNNVAVFLLKNGVKVKNNQKRMMLIQASKFKLFDVVKFLVPKMDKLNGTDENGNTAYKIAKIYGNTEIAQFLSRNGAK